MCMLCAHIGCFLIKFFLPIKKKKKKNQRKAKPLFILFLTVTKNNVEPKFRNAAQDNHGTKCIQIIFFQ